MFPLLVAVVLFASPAVPPPLTELHTEHFRILSTPRAQKAAHQLGPRLEAERARFREVLGRDWPGVTDVRLGVDRAEMEALSLDGKPPSWAVALAYPDRDLLLLDAASLADPSGQQTLRHELAHVALGQLGKGWPHWFQEGFAMYFSGERFAVSQYATLYRAVKQERVFRFEDLATAWPEHGGDVEIAYAQSVSFVAELLERHGPSAFGALIDDVGRGVPFEQAFARAFHATLSTEEDHWRAQLPARYAWLPLSTSTSLLYLFAACLCVLAYLRLKSAQAHRRAVQAAEEAAQDAAARLAAALPEAENFPAEEGSFPLLSAADVLEAMESADNSGPDDGPPPTKPTVH